MIRPETLNFIAALSDNNDRGWFAAHKDEYDAARADVLNFITELTPILETVDPAFPKESPAKKHLLRIYRDVRFSKDKRPYKNNFGIYFSLIGKNGNEPGYYINLSPGHCFFAAGYWMPAAEDLKKIREEIDYNQDEFLEIINNEDFKSIFKLDDTDTLKKAPKGYPLDHPLIHVLKLKSLTAIYPIPDKAFFKADITEKIHDAFKHIYPFMLFLRTAIAN
jgi:uncharacterized protein (TIGR02453 family)